MNADEAMAEYIDRRSDPKLTSERHDEIIALRMYLFDIRDALKHSDDPKVMEVRKGIVERARTWGKEGDCV